MRLAFLVVSLFSFVDARVTFQYSQVLQQQDLENTNKATFKCVNPCKVFANKKTDNIVVTQNGNVVASLATIVGPTVFTPMGFALPAGDYVLENKGEVNPEFLVYIVDSKAPNNGASVLAPQDTVGVTIGGTARYATVISSFEAVWFSGFSGNFPAGYPRIYATGYDAGFDQCHPVYQARSQYNAEVSWPTIPSAMLTVDFGYVGDHNLTAHSGKLKDMSLNGGTSTVFTSPGYIGCTSTPGQNYYSLLSGVERTFSLGSDSLDIDGAYYALSNDEPVRLVVNNQLVNLVGAGGVYNAHYPKKAAFDVSISWRRQTVGSNFALQFDFGNDNDPQLHTTTKAGSSLNALCALTLVIATCLWQ